MATLSDKQRLRRLEAAFIALYEDLVDCPGDVPESNPEDFYRAFKRELRDFLGSQPPDGDYDWARSRELREKLEPKA